MVTALVPMKEHSERVPQKNFRLLAGKPAFHWILESLSKSEYIKDIVINTDSEKIAKNALDHFDVTILKRPEFLLGDMVNIQPLIEYDLSKSTGEYYLQTHSTNPLVPTSSFDKAIELFLGQSNHDALFSVTPIKTRYYWENGKAINHDPSKLLRTQDLMPIYEENSCIYIFSKSSFKINKNRLGTNPMMFPMNRFEAVDIDDVEDFYWAEYLLNKRQYGKVK